ncbi:MAG: hypothetical protein ACLUNZ_09590 [Evtepia sp.]
MKRRTIGILTLCAVLALLVLNWQTQPFHRLQDRNVVPLSVGIVRSDARGSKTVNLQGSQAVQALQACARRTVPLWVGPTEKAYAPEDGSVYHVTVAGEKNGKYDELCNVTVDGKGFIHANSSRYHLVGIPGATRWKLCFRWARRWRWRDAYESQTCSLRHPKHDTLSH